MVKVTKLEVWKGAVGTALATRGLSDDAKYTIAHLVQYSVGQKLNRERKDKLRDYAKKIWDNRTFKL